MANLEKIVDELSTLTILEAAELAKLLEAKWGVSAAAAVAVGSACQEGRQAGKTERTPEIVIEYLRDGGAPEFVAEFHVVLSRLPGIVVNEVPVGVDAIFRQRVGGANLREASNAGRGKPTVVGACASIQTDRVRHETLVLRKKSLREPVPAIP